MTQITSKSIWHAESTSFLKRKWAVVRWVDGGSTRETLKDRRGHTRRFMSWDAADTAAFKANVEAGNC